MNTFCTIITASHIPYARALFESLRKFDKDIYLNVLVVDQPEIQKGSTDGLLFHCLDAVASSSDVGRCISEKYNKPDMQDELRWSLKPILITYLFEQGYEKVVFTDPDTFYFSDFKFLFGELDENDILLTPHWRGLNPKVDNANFELQFVGGLFNGGFIAVSKNAGAAMNWWADSCLYRCEKNFSIGHYVDQTYLNLMPVYFDKVKILRHQGCNVANWNQVVCQRELVSGEVLINRKWEIVFLHFTKSTIKGILSGDDNLLSPHLDSYMAALSQHGLNLKLAGFKDPTAIPTNRLKKAVKDMLGRN